MRSIPKGIEGLLDRSGIDPTSLEKITKVNVWQGMYKDAEGEAHVVDMMGVQATPVTSDVDIMSMLVRDAQPTKVYPTKRKRPDRAERLTAVIPDMQIGYRGEEPFHDETAMALAQEIIADLHPDRVVFLGDNLDLPSMSRYEQRADWQGRTQQALDRLHGYFAQTRANVPNADIVALTGNHEKRMEDYIRRNASEVLGLRRAQTDEAPALALSSLLRTAELEVDYVAGYPHGRYWLEDDLVALHGKTVRSNGSTAGAVVRQADYSTIFGHVHKIELAKRTVDTRQGGREITAATFGTLARVDGHVPSGSFTTDERNELIPSTPNWQQGLGLIVSDGDGHQMDAIAINNGRAKVWGKVYGSKQEVELMQEIVTETKPATRAWREL